MNPIVKHWLTTTLALSVAAWILPGVKVASLAALVTAGVVLGLVNAIVKPALVVLTLPLTFLTLGVFYFIVNGVSFSLAAWIVPGFSVQSFGWSILGAGFVGLLSMLIGGFRRRTSRVPVDVIDIRPEN